MLCDISYIATNIATHIEGTQFYEEDATPLHIAVSHKDIEMVKLLLENGATVTIIEGTKTSLDCAANSDCQEIVDLLLDKGVLNGNSRRRLMSSAIYYAAYRGNLELVKFFLNEGVALRTSENSNVINKPALHVSAEKGHLEIFKILLAETLTQGGHVDDCDNKLMTALHYVVTNGFRGMTDSMIEERNIPSDIIQDHVDRKEMIEILLAHGADIDARDIHGKTPLHYSAYNSDYNAAAAVFLIKQGANFNAEKVEGWNLISCTLIHEEMDDDYWDPGNYWRYGKKIKLTKNLIREIVLRVNVENADYLSQNLLQTI